jgi:transcriptional regulator with XRE-family HTH domain
MANTDYINWLREQMRAKGWRQAELAHAAHVDPAVVSNILTGKRGPGFDTCSAFAAALQLPPEVVFEAAGLLSPRDKTKDAYLAEINSIYEKFDKENKRESLEFFRMLLRLQDEQGGTHAKQGTLPPK